MTDMVEDMVEARRQRKDKENNFGGEKKGMGGKRQGKIKVKKYIV